jgi:hypothetical protein
VQAKGEVVVQHRQLGDLTLEPVDVTSAQDQAVR